MIGLSVSGHWVVFGGLVWAAAIVAIIAVNHRAHSGQWRPYTDDEVNDPDWDERR